MRYKTKNYLLLTFLAIWFTSCREDYGGYYPTYCNNPNTAISMHVQDYLTKAPLDSVHIALIKNDSSFFNSFPGPELLEELVTANGGQISFTFEHGTAFGITYYCYLLPDSGYYTTEIWNVPGGCETAFDIALKKAMPAQLSLTNTSGIPLIGYAAQLIAVPRYRDIGIIGNSQTILDEFVIDTIRPNETKSITVKSLPDELLRLNSTFTSGITTLTQSADIETSIENYLTLSVKL